MILHQNMVIGKNKCVNINLYNYTIFNFVLNRCLSIINPIKSESRSAESWRGLIGRIRHLMLTAYDRTLLKFEVIIREHREKRNQTGWNFCDYFLLQVIFTTMQ
jgi:hypothetical protein